MSLLAVLSVAVAGAQNTSITLDFPNWKAGESHFDEHEWTEVIAGDIPLVITVPHSGTKKPKEMADRTCKDEQGRLVRGWDRYTADMAHAIRNAFLEKYNKSPYFVINHVHRRKVDQNRDIVAVCGDEKGEEAWNNFHIAADSAIADVLRKFGHTLYIDLHAHGHENQRLELGYNLTKEELQKAFKKEDLKKYAAKSSMSNYIAKNPDTDIWELLFGAQGFGAFISKEGLPATPAMQDPHPVGDERFFSGGYNTRRYTSSEHPNVFGFQIESNYRKVRDSKANMKLFAEAFGRAYYNFANTLGL